MSSLNLGKVPVMSSEFLRTIEGSMCLLACLRMTRRKLLVKVCLLLKNEEVTKTGVVKFLASGLLLEMEVARQPLIAAADNKQTVTSPADAQNKQLNGVIDWNDPELVRKPHYLFWCTLVRTDRPTTKPEHERIPTPESG